MMKRFTILFGLACMAKAIRSLHAESLDIAAIGVHTASAHAPRFDYQNNAKWGIYARTNSGFNLGAYRNTYSRMSAYGSYQWKAWGPVDLAVGAATGYTACSMCPMAAAIITLGKIDKASSKSFCHREPTPLSTT